MQRLEKERILKCKHSGGDAEQERLEKDRDIRHARVYQINDGNDGDRLVNRECRPRTYRGVQSVSPSFKIWAKSPSSALSLDTGGSIHTLN